MSYDPSHRKPPRQERWPQATPPEAWPAYPDGAYQDGEQADGRYRTDRQGAGLATAGYQRSSGYQASGGSGDHGYQPAVATDTFARTRNGYGEARENHGWTADGYADISDGYGTDTGTGYGTDAGYGTDTRTGYGTDTRTGYGTGSGNGYGSAGNGNGYGTDGYASGPNGYARAVGGYAGAADDFDWDGNGDAGNGYGYGYGYAGDGFAGARDDFTGSPGYLDQDSYAEPGFSGAMLVAPDTGAYPGSWQADQDQKREMGHRGLIVGAVTGFLAAAVAIGVSTLVAAFVRPQASPAIAVGRAFIDRTPAALKNLAVQHFGASGRTVLLLAMYIMIAFLAMAVGVLTRRAAALGVAAVAAFSVVGAFVAITRPEGRVTDVSPSIIGGLAGVAALLWLVRASTPVAALRYARGGSRRRAR